MSWNDLSMQEKAEIMRLAVQNGVYNLDSIRDGYNEYAKGGRIHIAPSKRGTFTAAASKHGKSVQAFASQVLAHKENYSPAMVKKANFARNASKWNHAEGGNLYSPGGWLSNAWNWVKNAVQVGAIADNPAVMTAAGHRVNRGKAVQDKQNNREVKQLRENLTKIGDAAATAPFAPEMLEAGIQLATHPIQTVKTVKSAIKQGANYIKTKRANARLDKAYMEALNKGDMAEVQRLRDQHFIEKAPNTKIRTEEGKPAHIYHGTDKDWVSYDPAKFGSATDEGYYGVGLYGTEYKPLAKGYGNNVLDIYINSERPFTAGTQDIIGTPYSLNEAVDRGTAIYHFNRGSREGMTFNPVTGKENFSKILKEMDNADAAVYGTPSQRFNEVIVPRGEQMKFANAITYDDAGNIIPLSKRDNFNINDLRYSLLPIGIPTFGYGLYKNSDK